MTKIDFRDQTAIVTGAGRGLGKAYALELARRGARVIVSDIGGTGEDGPSWAEAVVNEIEAGGGIAQAAHDSVATSQGGAAIVDKAITAFGRVDIIVHNAGFLRPAMVEDMSDAQWRDVLDVHLTGAFNVVRPAWGHFKAQDYGRVVLTSSSSIFGYPGSVNYVAAKAGLIGLTAALAEEARGSQIGVNAILPYAVSDIVADNPPVGVTPTRTVEALQRIRPLRTADSVVPLLVFLASRTCSVSGQAFSSLAGRHARVAFQLARGWISDNATTTAEEVAANFHSISSTINGFEPDSMFDEIDNVFEDLKRTGILKG